MKFLFLVFSSLISTQEIHRTDVVYAEAFGTIEVEEPYASNQYVHFHIFSPQEEFPRLKSAPENYFETRKDDRSSIYQVPAREKRKLGMQ